MAAGFLAGTVIVITTLTSLLAVARHKGLLDEVSPDSHESGANQL